MAETKYRSDEIDRLFGTADGLLDVIADQQPVMVVLPVKVLSLAAQNGESALNLQGESGQRFSVRTSDVSRLITRLNEEPK